MNGWLLAIGVVVLIPTLAWAFRLRPPENHAGLARDEFVEHLGPLGVSLEVSRAVYDHFKVFGSWESFMPHPRGTLESTYRLVFEDVARWVQWISTKQSEWEKLDRI